MNIDRSIVCALLSTGILVLSGCSIEAMDEADQVSPENVDEAQQALTDAEMAQAYRPRFNHGSTVCFPLTFKEISPDASASDIDGLKSKCKGSYDPNFVVFASAKRAGESGIPYASYWDATSFRVTYGVAYGQQNTSLGYPFTDISIPGVDLGTHGEDKQYLVVDVVNNAFTSTWADAHKGNYVRVKSQLSMYNGDHVNVWAGKNYHALYTVTDRTTICDGQASGIAYDACAAVFMCAPYTSNCPGLDEIVMNFGDPVGSSHQDDGKLVIVDDVCATSGTSYTSPDGITYSGAQLTALKAFVGCDGATGVWSGSFRSQAAYSTPYQLKGCDSGNTDGGDICNAADFGAGDQWTTWSGSNRFLDPSVVGSADPDYAAGGPFNDMLNVFKRPSSITIRTGARVDAVSVTYIDGNVRSHGGTGGSAHTISGLDTDPVVSVDLCEATKDGRVRAGHIKLTTLSGRTLEGGDGSSNCKTIAPANKALFGFYGRSGAEMDVLGTYWGNR
jgi:hypothetical protein